MRPPLVIRVSDHILGERDWRAAARRYAQEHDRYYASLHRIHTWFRDLWFGAGAEANKMRARALPRIAEDPSRIPDFIAWGPEIPTMKLRGDACLVEIRTGTCGLWVITW
jgi:hypothetical protein